MAEEQKKAQETEEQPTEQEVKEPKTEETVDEKGDELKSEIDEEETQVKVKLPDKALYELDKLQKDIANGSRRFFEISETIVDFQEAQRQLYKQKVQKMNRRLKVFQKALKKLKLDTKKYDYQLDAEGYAVRVPKRKQTGIKTVPNK